MWMNPLRVGNNNSIDFQNHKTITKVGNRLFKGFTSLMINLGAYNFQVLNKKSNKLE